MPPKIPSMTIADTQLGLTPEDLETYRRHQSLALGRASRSSSSRSTATEPGQHGFLLDPSSLQVMASHFDRVSVALQQRLDALQRETQIVTQRQAQQARMSIRAANAEIARMHAILRQIDELETECDKIRRIRDIVRSFRARLEAIERRFGS